MVKSYWFFSAFVLAAAIAGVHVFIGGRLIARPLLDSGLESFPRLTLYLCWHGVTIVLAGMAALFAMSARDPARRAEAAIATTLAALFLALIVGLLIAFEKSPIALPQWVVFAPMAACGAAGLRAQARK